MKNELEKFIGRNFYSIYSYGRSNYDYKSKKISFESQLFTHLIKEQMFFCFNIDPVFIFDFDCYNLSKISIENHVENSSIYGNDIPNITRCVLANTKKIKKILVYGFSINEILESSFDKEKSTTENFILFEFEDSEKIFFDTSCEISSITLILDTTEIKERIKDYGLIEAYCLE
jgi:hypothetical protein